MNLNLAGDYELANDIDCSDTVNWNSGKGFKPVGPSGDGFIGSFDGQGYNITGLVINRPTEDQVGLFGIADVGAQISNVALLGGSVSGDNNVGSLAGASDAVIENTYSTALVSGSAGVGGLLGFNLGTISNSYATGSVSATGSAGVFRAGGLVGQAGNVFVPSTGSIINCYSTGVVSGTGADIGGLVGLHRYPSMVTSSYWDTETSGQSSSAVGEGKTTNEMSQQATFVGWSFNTIWWILENTGYPLLLVSSPSPSQSNRQSQSRSFSFSQSESQSSTSSHTATQSRSRTLSQSESRSPIKSQSPSDSQSFSLSPSFSRSNSQSSSQSCSSSNSQSSSQSRSSSNSESSSQSPSSSNSQSSSSSNSQSSSSSNSQSHSSSGSQSASSSLTQSQGIGFIMDCIDLQNMTNNLIGRYILTGPINCTETSTWNNGAGFEPVGTLLAPFSGTFTGNNYVITGLTINRLTADNVGLFGVIDNTAQISEAGLEEASIQGRHQVGILVGLNQGSVSTSYATGTVSGINEIGSLVGRNGGVLSNSYALVSISGSGSAAGGLLGHNQGVVDSSYASGSVSGNLNAGGLIGLSTSGTVTDSYWDVIASGQSVSAGGTGKSTIEMHRAATFSSWDATNTWWLSCGAYPILKAFNPVPVVSTNISTCAKLQSLCEDLDYFLVNDIDCSASSTWNDGAGFVPLGSNQMAFIGSLVGNNHVITGFTINLTSTDNVGLFGVTGNTAQIRGVRLEGASIDGQNQVGMLVGFNRGTVTACYAEGTVSGNVNIGGLAGTNSETAIISQSAAEGTLVAHDIAGGIVGLNEGVVEDSYSLASTLIDAPKGKAGGLAGNNIGTLQHSYAAGCVRSAASNAQLGGLVGAMSGRKSIIDCYWDKSTTGHVFAGPKSTQRSHGKQTSTMYTPNTFKDWDFTNIWSIEPGKSYPFFQAFANNTVPTAPTEKCPSSALFGQWLTLAVSTISVMAFFFLLLLYGRNLFLLRRWRSQTKRPLWYAPAYLGQQDVIIFYFRQHATADEKQQILEVLLENNHVSIVQALVKESMVTSDDTLRKAWGSKLAERGYHAMATCLGLDDAEWEAYCEQAAERLKENRCFYEAIKRKGYYLNLVGLKQDIRWPKMKQEIERAMNTSVEENITEELLIQLISLSSYSSQLSYDGSDYYYEVNKMLQSGFNPNYLTEGGISPLDEVMNNGDIALSKCLVQHRANLYLSTNEARPLEKLLCEGQRLSARQLVEQGGYPPLLKQSLEQTLEAIQSNDALLKTINLSGRLCDNYTVYLLCLALRENQVVEALDLAYNEISLLGVSTIARLLQEHPSLRRINLSCNLIDERGVAELLTLLSSNPCLKEIELEGNVLIPDDDPAYESLQQALLDRQQKIGVKSGMELSTPSFEEKNIPLGLRFQVWFQHYKAMMLIAFLVEIADKISDCILIRELAENREQKLAIASLIFLLASYVVGAASVQQMRDPGQVQTWTSRLKRLLWLPVLGPEFARLVWNVEYVDKRFAWLRLANFLVEDAPQFIVGVIFLNRKGINSVVLAKVVLAFCFSVFFTLKFLLYDFSAARVKMRNTLHNVGNKVQKRLTKQGGIEMHNLGAPANVW